MHSYQSMLSWNPHWPNAELNDFQILQACERRPLCGIGSHRLIMHAWYAHTMHARVFEANYP